MTEGLYYVQFPFQKAEIVSNYDLRRYAQAKDGDKIKVLEVVPSYEEMQEIKAQLSKHKEYCCCAKNEVLILENTKLKEKIKHLSRTQARQFRDNQKLQVKAEHAKDVVNIDTAWQIKQLKEVITKMCCELVDDNDDMSTGLAEYFNQDLLIKIREVLK